MSGNAHITQHLLQGLLYHHETHQNADYVIFTAERRINLSLGIMSDPRRSDTVSPYSSTIRSMVDSIFHVQKPIRAESNSIRGVNQSGPCMIDTLTTGLWIVPTLRDDYG